MKSLFLLAQVSLSRWLGCVVAGRLAYADPTLQVMLIEGKRLKCWFSVSVISTSFEGGNNNRDDPWVYRPGIYVRNMQRDGV